jgi:hypothetical protein
MKTHLIHDIDSLYNFIGYVVLGAPDQFPKEDYLSDEDQMTLDKAFEELRHGITLVEKDLPGADLDRGLTAVLEESLAYYRSGHEVKGAHRLRDFENLIYKTS